MTWRGDDEREPRLLAEGLDQLARRLGLPTADAVTVVFDRWSEVVGEAAAAHSRPERVRDGVLAVAVDHAAWATSLAHLEQAILTRLDAAIGEGTVTSLVFRVRRSV